MWSLWGSIRRATARQRVFRARLSSRFFARVAPEKGSAPPGRELRAAARGGTEFSGSLLEAAGYLAPELAATCTAWSGS